MNILSRFLQVMVGWFLVKKLFKILALAFLMLGGWMVYKSSAAPVNTLPLPRFASLRSNEVNLRVGPGMECPVEWIFKQEKMPVEIVLEFETWRKIRDFEGAEGWVHQNMLSGKRTVLITAENVLLLKKPDLHAVRLAKVEPGVIGKLIECQGPWCRLQIDKLKGWLHRDHFWGVYSHEFRDNCAS